MVGQVQKNIDPHFYSFEDEGRIRQIFFAIV